MYMYMYLQLLRAQLQWLFLKGLGSIFHIRLEYFIRKLHL